MSGRANEGTGDSQVLSNLQSNKQQESYLLFKYKALHTPEAKPQTSTSRHKIGQAD
jgi:hypothetical protein